MSINELPYVGTLCFWVVSEEHFIRLTSPELWGHAGMDFITSSGKRSMSKELVPMAILITDGVGKGSLGMVTNFCHSDQAEVEPWVMLSTLVHWELHEPAVVVTKIFTNSPYF